MRFIRQTDLHERTHRQTDRHAYIDTYTLACRHIVVSNDLLSVDVT